MRFGRVGSLPVQPELPGSNLFDVISPATFVCSVSDGKPLEITRSPSASRDDLRGAICDDGRHTFESFCQLDSRNGRLLGWSLLSRFSWFQFHPELAIGAVQRWHDE